MCTHIYLCIAVYLYIHVYICIEVYIYVFIYIYVYIHMYVHIYVYEGTRCSAITPNMCDMTRSYVWYDSSIPVTWLVHTRYLTYSVHTCDTTRLDHLCDITCSYVWRDSCIYVTWLIHMFDMICLCVWHDLLDWCCFYLFVTNSLVALLEALCARAYVWRDSCICVTWLIHMFDMIFSCVWHDSSICFASRIRMRDMTCSYV